MKHQLIELHSQINALSSDLLWDTLVILTFIFLGGILWGNHK